MKIKILAAVTAIVAGTYALHQNVDTPKSLVKDTDITITRDLSIPAVSPHAANNVAKAGHVQPSQAPTAEDINRFVADLDNNSLPGNQTTNPRVTTLTGTDIFNGEKSPDFGHPFQLFPSGESPLVVTDAGMARQIVLRGGKDILGIGENDDLALKTSKFDEMNNVFYKFTQVYNGVPVYGRETVVQADGNNEIKLVTGEFEPGINIGVSPGLSGKAAFSKAVDSMRDVLLTEPKLRDDPTLKVYVSEEAGPILTWHSVMEYHTTTEGFRVDEVFVDANSGNIIDKLPNLYSALSRSVYTVDLKCFNPNSNKDVLPGREVTSSTDEHTKSAYDNSGYTYWFYANLFGRDSFDGHGKEMVSTVHARFTSSIGGCTGDNAYFDGEQMIYGEGDKELSNPAGALDVVAHELTHGVTHSESSLIYRNESGAINEALSDIFGAGAETYLESGGNGNTPPPDGLKPERKNWTLGEDATVTGELMRDMADPTADGQSSDSYDTRYTGRLDNGGVHLNSGIMNLAFYLLSEGGTHPQSKTTNRVTGIGMEKALKIYYHANTNLFTSSTNFESARTRLAQSAETLFGECSDAWHAVHQSFDAVKVNGDWTPCDSGVDDNGTKGKDDDGSDKDDGSTDSPASNASASASSYYNWRYLPANLLDGSSSTSWVSSTIRDTGDMEWVLLDLGAARSLSGLTISWDEDNYAEEYDIWVRQDGQWVHAQGVQQSRSGSADIELQDKSQYVLITMNHGHYGRWYGINEITLK
ncbi:zinc metalloprotease [Hahella sp. CCB-MM4]|uniref:M4 family metallopeptidase n=1 Tax=Hahella sp. (strain CCB-MM4) TaxID=1926491 RepID=UPI000B9BDF1E|nr:M4 family metallopeptidase [Hahella sp. CCB-MM4]OZG74055.1 zinc metalloprotease [Hahella sp. CCB-MM4]